MQKQKWRQFVAVANTKNPIITANDARNTPTAAA